MTAIKRCCALALAVLMILTALPVTAFAETAAHETNASLHETTLDGIANDITRQVLRSSQKDGERIQMENTAKLDDSDEVEIIVVVNDSVADPDSRAQVNALLRTQKSALAQIERALDTKVEPQRQYTTLLNGFSATVTYGQYKAIRKLDCVQSAFISPTFELLPDTANSNRMIGGGIYNTTGFTGEGMLVAILDTGVDMGHEVFKAAPKSPSLTQEKLRTLLETLISRWRASSRASACPTCTTAPRFPSSSTTATRIRTAIPAKRAATAPMWPPPPPVMWASTMPSWAWRPRPRSST